ncbi:hypothetical protein JIM95_004920 [Corynebacterium sp. CCM 8835]|uniref:Uncharacterized protein n=1 Tax=Corynebacterium antarcticum TaxID=2800405 RepID=A0A9Q4GNP1_9CORY|nr:hypothetical protein [Corynebacterium antarcticum]MCK7642573.1 hypothetical protein [Corynebacterium antarcticum]MCL0245488.1 hypothetical protein [Corynebacterium antarcticum]MCX7492057.1 hypothetical protein [Corynebacterium antarcticum]MCX7537894.1 hypothetical protein [Corynebacterium antarcticum]MCX7540059.1 hypothetical protein [Corynebacterium antarcticum]
MTDTLNTTTTGGTADPAHHPTIAVLDATDPTLRIVWHVQTDPNSATGRYSGAWIVGETPADGGTPDSEPDPEGADAGTPETGSADPVTVLESLLRGTVLLPVGDTDPDAVDGAATRAGTTTLAAIHAGLTRAADEIRAAAKKAHEKNTHLTVPRLPAVTLPDDGPDSGASFHGEKSARAAWCMAQAAGDLVEQWFAIESQRRSRAHLKETFDPDVRPLPLG